MRQQNSNELEGKNIEKPVVHAPKIIMSQVTNHELDQL